MSNTAATPDHDLDIARLEPWLAKNVDGFGTIDEVVKFPGGQSNPTYKIVSGDNSYVLRRKPFGPLLPSAHAVDREYKLISALHPTGFPVARPYALCEDDSVIGAMFYVMGFVGGRTIVDGQIPGVDNADRRVMYENLIKVLAQLHNTDYEAAGLSEYGKPGNYFVRQVGRWTKQYRGAQTDDIPEVEKLIAFLPETVPQQDRSSVIHGDYRIDNVMYAPDSPKIVAVLDWELSTIGDPLADFTYLAMHWSMPNQGNAGLMDVDLETLNIPTLEQAVELYCAETGRSGVPDLNWYFAYNLFRLVGIVQGIKKRVLNGNASSAKAEAAAARVVPLAQASWEFARRAGAPA